MNNPGAIYLFDNKRLFKVGKSVNMESREKNYITENPDNTCLCTVLVEDVDAAEAVILNMTKDYAHSHPKSGKSTEWRQRHPHVIDLFIRFAEEHGIHKLSQWAKRKQQLETDKANLASTQYHTEEESPSVRHWKAKYLKDAETNLQALSDNHIDLEKAAENIFDALDESRRETAQAIKLYGAEVEKNWKLEEELNSLKKSSAYRLEIDQMTETRPSIVPIPQSPNFDHKSPAFKALIGAMGCIAVFAVAVIFRVLL